MTGDSKPKQLLILHGPPACGKLTIAKELEAQIGASIFHNHLTLEPVKSIFYFGTDEFWALVKNLRLMCFEAFAKNGSGVMTFTWCYEHPADLDFLEEIETIAGKEVDVLPVYLKCDQAELEKRVSAPARKRVGKLTSVVRLKEFIEKMNCVAIPRENCIEVATDQKTPQECAREIARLLRLANS